MTVTTAARAKWTKEERKAGTTTQRRRWTLLTSTHFSFETPPLDRWSAGDGPYGGIDECDREFEEALYVATELAEQTAASPMLAQTQCHRNLQTSSTSRITLFRHGPRLARSSSSAVCRKRFDRCRSGPRRPLNRGGGTRALQRTWRDTADGVWLDDGLFKVGETFRGTGDMADNTITLKSFSMEQLHKVALVVSVPLEKTFVGIYGATAVAAATAGLHPPAGAETVELHGSPRLVRLRALGALVPDGEVANPASLGPLPQPRMVFDSAESRFELFNVAYFHAETPPLPTVASSVPAPLLLPHRRSPVVLELFAGAGGMSIGFHRAGFQVRYLIERDPSCVATLRVNRAGGNGGAIVYEEDVRTFLTKAERGDPICPRPDDVDHLHARSLARVSLWPTGTAARMIKPTMSSRTSSYVPSNISGPSLRPSKT